MGLIFAEVEANSGSQTLANLRLVSKYWQAAVTAYPISPAKPIAIHDQQNVQRLCRLLPNMERLTLNSSEKAVILGPLSALSALNSLTINGHSTLEADLDTDLETDTDTSANLRPLPGSLRELRIDSLSIQPDCFRAMKCVYLTSLRCRFGEHSQPEIWRLLKRLPNLEVLSNACRLPHLSLAVAVNVRAVSFSI